MSILNSNLISILALFVNSMIFKGFCLFWNRFGMFNGEMLEGKG